MQLADEPGKDGEIVPAELLRACWERLCKFPGKVFQDLAAFGIGQGLVAQSDGHALKLFEHQFLVSGLPQADRGDGLVHRKSRLYANCKQVVGEICILNLLEQGGVLLDQL